MERLIVARQKKIQFWVSEREYEDLKEYAAEIDLTMSEVLRDFVKSLKSRPTLRADDGVLDPNFR
jgi:hypothetical protein